MCMAIQRLESLRVRDVMSDKVMSISQDEPMSTAVRLLAKHGFAAVPVVDDAGRCVGMLSATDFIRGNANNQAPQQEEQQSAGEAVRLGRETGGSPPAEQAADLVAQHMTRAVQTVDAEQPLLKAAEIMCAGHIHRVPALDAAGRPLGIVSTMDIVSALVNAMDEMRIRES